MNLSVAIGQINSTIGDITGNAKKIENTYRDAVEKGADVVLTPELGLIGYPPQDLLYRSELIRACERTVDDLARRTGNTALVLGTPWRLKDARKTLANALVVMQNGERKVLTRKCLLPTYDVFDEERYFREGRSVECVQLHGENVALTICEDLWPSEFLPERVTYDFDPASELKERDPDVLINIAASPYWMGKTSDRKQIFSDLARDLDTSLVYCNTVGANDEIVFDGRSLAVSPSGTVIREAASFKEDLVVLEPVEDEEKGSGMGSGRREKNVLDALELGLRDYVRKCGFDQVLLGLSGGIDSTMTACVAARALGSDNVLGVSMPTRYTSDESRSDAERLADRLDIDFREIEIEPVFRRFMEELEPVFKGREPGVAAENLQARIRGNLLMAISNFSGRLLLATGNKSELSVGYCTLYGDMAGGIAPIGDVPKTLVYDLASYVNEKSGEEVIPERILEKPPSAELRPDQTDQDTLPPYDVLDQVLGDYIVRQRDLREMIAGDQDEELVREIVRRVDRNEFKRRQAPPVLKVTSRAFGIGRHMPIAKRIRFDEERQDA